MTKKSLHEAVRQAAARVEGWQKLEHAQHALLVTTAIHAFGDDPRAALFVEEAGTSGRIPRPDLIVLHPDVGVLVIENKGIRLGHIHAVTGSSLTLIRNGRLTQEDPFHQSERVVMRLKDLARRHVNLDEALFLNTAALPRIERVDFEARFGAIWPTEALFGSVCSDPAAFRMHMLAFAEACQQRSGKRTRLSKQASDALQSILDGKSILYAGRHTYFEPVEPGSLGLEIQQLELGLKQLTPQQHEVMNSDLRGAHRLFRGVAGSGKSVMLAYSAAKTLQRYEEEKSSQLFEAPASDRQVLVVCFNKTLVHFLKEKIDDCYGRLTWSTPNPQQLWVTHFERLVKQLEKLQPKLKTGLTFKEKAERAKQILQRFETLAPSEQEALLYDAVYLDESQDLAPEEIQLLVRLARRHAHGKQTVNLFYDNAQNIYGVTPPVWQQLGVEIVGRTTFLDQCLRNTEETLALAFNVLVGAFAPEGERVTTRTFADVAALRSRKLIEENGDHFKIRFAPRSGPAPDVAIYSDRESEIQAAIDRVTLLVREQRVLPSDILVLYKSHYGFKGMAEGLASTLGKEHQVRIVDTAHDKNKNAPLIQSDSLTISTIASAKGYDAPVVYIVGADGIDTDTKGRASFYVAATRAKLHLIVSGVTGPSRTLFDEVIETAHALRPPTTPVASLVPSLQPLNDADTAISAHPCRHCGSTQLHAQRGRFGYFFKCINCTGNTPMELKCTSCGRKARIQKMDLQYFRNCDCGERVLLHTNVPLDSL